MGSISLIRHGRLPWLLLWHVKKLQILFHQHSFWAQRRSQRGLVRMLLGSRRVVSAWSGQELVGFGRATSDGVYRAVLWDVLVAEAYRGQGIGTNLVQGLLQSGEMQRVEKIYLMTTKSAQFYHKLGFSEGHGQRLLLMQKQENLD
jgi:ribosomal protein S18 acetylase RimI-like enzyme